MIIDGKLRIPAKIGIARPDVAIVHADYPGNDRSGFEVVADLEKLSYGYHELAVVAVNKVGVESVLGKRTYVHPQFDRVWYDLLTKRGHRPNETFYYAFATSNVAEGDAGLMAQQYGPYVSETVKVGVRVPILYMRTTQGREHDWIFDPDWDTSRRCGERRIAEDSLNGLLKWSVDNQVPVLITLNGGIWADSACGVPDWDITDYLEQDAANCQWNEHDEVMADDYLRNLPGSVDAPELARALTLNVHATNVRSYKKRNLQQAARTIKLFADRHPHLFIGISLDPDVYINPFFEGTQWYDYNPSTLSQFRQWLSGTGPYAKVPASGVPDLSLYRRKTTYTLEAIRAISLKRFDSWDEVSPPRAFHVSRLLLKTTWATLWEQFRRHLVKVHYDELSQWVTEAGIDRDRIYSSQGFGAPDEIINFEPFAIRIDSPPKSYDTGGASVEGAVPSHGHLGVILYGDGAINVARMETKQSMFRTFRQADPDWALIEYNTADLKTPRIVADLSRGYRSLRDVTNFGARLVSPMAWNGPPGSSSALPGFASYTSFRLTPLETAVQAMLVNRANLPRQARMWGFGFGLTEDSDGWTATGNARATPTTKGLLLSLPRGRASVYSPLELDFSTEALDALIVRTQHPDPSLRVSIDGRERGSLRWKTLTAETTWQDRNWGNNSYLFPLGRSLREIEQVRLNFNSTKANSVGIESIVLYPSPGI